MILSLPQAFWSALAAVGLQFALLQWRLKNAGQRDFGFSVSALAAASAAETWNPGWPHPWVRSATEAGFLWAMVFAARLAGRYSGSDKTLIRAMLAIACVGSALLAQGWFAERSWIVDWPSRAALCAQAVLCAYAGLRRIPIAAAGGESRSGSLLAAACLALSIAALLATEPQIGTAACLLPALLYACLGITVLLAEIAGLDRRNRQSLASLASAYSRLREETRLEELGASAAFISHEIKNHVHAMKGSASLLRTGEGEHAREALLDLGGTVNRLEMLASDIAAYAAPRPQTRLSRIALDRIYRKCAEAMASDACAFRVHGPWEETEIEGDAGQLEQVFLNLFKNSREAGACVVDVRFIAWGDRLVVTVEDDGCGCRPEELQRLFLPFVTGKAASGGSGLGTTIAERLLTDHGATIRAYAKNALGTGTGLRIDMVFARLGQARPDAPGFAVLARDPDCTEAIIRPLTNLGLGSRFVPSGGTRVNAIPVDTWFLFGAGRESPAAPPPGQPAWAVGADRVAHPLGSGRPFLFAEGEIVARLRTGAIA